MKAPGVILGVWDGTIGAFLLFWIIGIVSEIQRSEAIDISKMLHLPVSMRGIFFVNYLASHVTASIIVFVPWMLGLSIGLAAGRGWAMLWMSPVLGFIFMIPLDLPFAAGSSRSCKTPTIRRCRRDRWRSSCCRSFESLMNAAHDHSARTKQCSRAKEPPIRA
jgi:hypothetical protein